MRKAGCLAISAILLIGGQGVTPLLAGDSAKLAQALAAPIVEGRSLAGVRVGATEDEVVTTLGVPDRVDSSRPGSGTPFKVALYLMVTPVTLLRVVFREGHVEAVLVMTTAPSQTPVLTGKIRGGAWQFCSGRSCRLWSWHSRAALVPGCRYRVQPCGQGPARPRAGLRHSRCAARP